ncbi:hypothetical protein F511_24861 [Dorcoceras hygrometricum]|uniref:Uncharacterized protein n=1 Tax=Dorcoceras hygrometricum TaxID=472368 RepID=A0A2Z7BSU2_9LAMI|nr:hypothetical protein F511_24861 [Dorcoceras hygrometricum]
MVKHPHILKSKGSLGLRQEESINKERGVVRTIAIEMFNSEIVKKLAPVRGDKDPV